MMLESIIQYAAGISLLIGAFFTLVGAFGLMKLPDSMTRLHAPTKVGTIGVGALLLGSMINAFVIHDGSFHELLIMAFLFVTAPISANFMSKVNIHRQSCDLPPPPPTSQTWSTMNTREEDAPDPQVQQP